MRALTLIAMLLALTTVVVEARTRVHVYGPGVAPPTSRSNAAIICPWLTMGVPPETPPGHYTLGVCPSRLRPVPY